MNTLIQRRSGTAGQADKTAAQPFMNPYQAGFVLGLVLLATYAVTGRGLGATAGFAGLATWLAGWAGVEHLQSSTVHMKYWNEGAPLLNWTLFLLIGAVAGAALSGWQARRFSFTIERGPRITDTQRLMLAFAGGFVAACGAKLAKGCTSGQALTGSAVLNVMFTAVVTTMTGLAVLSGAGLFDLSEVYFESTHWTAQLVGGALFGAGFVVGGYCPGTSLAALATGRKDGMLFALGMLAGVWAYAEFTPGLDAWYQATSSGVITLPQATGIAMGWWVSVFVAVLAFGAWGMAKLEARFAYLKPAR